MNSKFYKKSIRSNTIAPYALLDSVKPRFSFTESMLAYIRGVDNTNVNVYKFGNSSVGEDYATLTDAWALNTIDPDTLHVLSRIKPPIPGGFILDPYIISLSTSHPLPEYGTSNYITFVVDMHGLSRYIIKVFRIVSAHQRELIASIPSDVNPYMHSFSGTREHAIFFAAPLIVDLETAMMSESTLDGILWLPDRPTLVYVVHLGTGHVTTLETETDAVHIHHINGYTTEDPNVLVVDAPVYTNFDIFRAYSVKTITNLELMDNLNCSVALKRYVIDLTRGAVTVSTFPSNPDLPSANKFDFPAINENFRYKPYCFVYGVAYQADAVHYSVMAVVKKDLCGQLRDRVWFTASQYPSEPQFIATPGGQEEDHGFLVFLVLDGKSQRSHVVVLNATTFEEVSESLLPEALPFRTHGRVFQ